MDGLLTLFLLSVGSALVSCSQSPHHEYVFININMSWPEARDYCRQNYYDLATIESAEDVQRVQNLPGLADETRAWIGLNDEWTSWVGVRRKELNSWRWSAGDEASPYDGDLAEIRPDGRTLGDRNTWVEYEPNFRYANEACVMMVNGRWLDEPCDKLKGFICFTDIPTWSYEYINTPSTWTDAQTYCRQHHTDLALIESRENLTEAIKVQDPGSAAWIGLYRVPWMWSDQTPRTFANWGRNNPSYPSRQHCVSNSKASGWEDDYCSENYVVICQTGPISHPDYPAEDNAVLKPLKKIMGVVMKSGTDLTQDLNNAQILQKLEEVLKSRGHADVRLSWRVRPVKPPPEKQTDQPQCENVRQTK